MTEIKTSIGEKTTIKASITYRQSNKRLSWVYRRWESQVDRGTYLFYEDDWGDKTYIKRPPFSL